MTSRIQLGDHVRFRAGMTPEALKGRERDVGIVIAFERQVGPGIWPVVQFETYRTTAIAPGLLEVVGEPSSTHDHESVN